MKKGTLLFGLCAILLAGGLSSCNNSTTTADDASATEEAVSAEDEGKAVQTTLREPAEKAMGVKVGDAAPTFKLKNIDGEMYSFENIKDANGETPKGFIVTFTCNTCPYAVMYEDRLIDLHNNMSPQGYPVVAIQPNDPELKAGDSFEAMQERAAEKGFPFLYLMDEGQEVYPQYGASRTPEIYLVDGEGIVRYHGAIDDNAQEPENVTVNYVEKAVESIENGQDPDPADVKAIGCTIKAKRT